MTDPAAASPVIIVMGVTGSGKTTIGKLLAKRLQIPFYDADDFHTSENLQKLADDKPLDDADREPWLQVLSAGIQKWSREGGAILACSALKHDYRSSFRRAAAQVRFVFLTGPPQVIARRVSQRARIGNHIIRDFESILKGQYKDLEIPTDAIAVDVTPAPDVIVDQIVSQLTSACNL